MLCRPSYSHGLILGLILVFFLAASSPRILRQLRSPQLQGIICFLVLSWQAQAHVRVRVKANVSVRFKVRVSVSVGVRVRVTVVVRVRVRVRVSVRVRVRLRLGLDCLRIFL